MGAGKGAGKGAWAGVAMRTETVTNDDRMIGTSQPRRPAPSAATANVIVVWAACNSGVGCL